jgi:hypothetical protein
MKKLTITAACVLAVAGAAFGQGAINWGSISFTFMTAQTNSASYSPLFGGGSNGSGAVGNAGGSAINGTGFYYELLVGSVWNGTTQAAPTNLGGFSAWSDSGLGATNSNNPGRLSVINPNSGATVNNMSSSVSNNLILVGWSANLGTSWSAAYSSLTNGQFLAGLSSTAFFGMTPVGVIEAAQLPTSVGNTIFGNTAQTYGTPINSPNTQLFAVPTPEPGTLALAAIGGASLLMFRRKK